MSQQMILARRLELAKEYARETNPKEITEDNSFRKLLDYVRDEFPSVQLRVEYEESDFYRLFFGVNEKLAFEIQKTCKGFSISTDKASTNNQYSDSHRPNLFRTLESALEYVCVCLHSYEADVHESYSEFADDSYTKGIESVNIGNYIKRILNHYSECTEGKFIPSEYYVKKLRKILEPTLDRLTNDITSSSLHFETNSSYPNKLVLRVTDGKRNVDISYYKLRLCVKFNGDNKSISESYNSVTLKRIN